MPATTFDLASLVRSPIAHRGLHACGGVGAVENSIAAALAAVERGFAIECDVRLSRDGEAMVFHDAVLDRLTDAAGMLDALDAADLVRLRLGGMGERLPTLAAFLEAVAGRVPVFVELKGCGDPRRDRRLADRTSALAQAASGLIALESFDPAIVAWCTDGGPRGLVGPGEPDGRQHDGGFAGAYDFVSWSIADLPTACTRFPGVPVTTWTVRTRAQADLAHKHGAQIVFEGFKPLAGR